MVKQVELDWSNAIEIDDEFFPEDKLDRAKYATFLTKLLASQGFDSSRDKKDQKRNYVLNLNAEWGAGKTYFLKRWSEELKRHYPVVYIDAWKKDYSDDPLLTVISAIIEQLRKQANKDSDDLTFKVPRKLIGLLKAAAPGITRGLAKRYIGIDPVEIMNSDDSSSVSNTLTNNDGNSIDMSTAASDMVNYLIKEHNAKSTAMESLKKSVDEWIEAVVGLNRLDYPAFIFIDELDRCRPNYAVEMLETIKHIFNIKGVVFVIATDTEQLQHAIKAIYGEGFDAKIYLSRFFNSRYSLKAPNLENFLDVHSDTSKLSGDSFQNIGIEILPFNEDARKTLRNIAVMINAFGISARTAIQITDRIIATISNMPQGSKLDILMLTTLLCIREKDSLLFEEIVSGRFYREIDMGEKKQRIYLNDYLKSYISESFHNNYFEMEFIPQKYTPILERYNNNKIKNDYSYGIYHFTIIDYLNDIFCPHFKSNGNSIFSLFRTDSSSSTQTPLQIIASSLYKNLKEGGCDDSHMFNKSTILWLRYIYINDKFDSIDIDEYRDFVELASPLDWMGKDELPEID